MMIANHTSHLDALLLAAALPCRLCDCVFPVAAGDVFFNTPTISLFSATLLNALPMWRKNCGPHALAELKKRLTRGAMRPDLVPGRKTQSRWNSRPLQAGSRHAHGRHGRSRDPLSPERSFSCFPTRGPIAPSPEDSAQDRAAPRFRRGAQSPRRLGGDRRAYTGGSPAARKCRPPRNRSRARHALMRNAHRSPDGPWRSLAWEREISFGKGSGDMPAHNTIPLCGKADLHIFRGRSGFQLLACLLSLDFSVLLRCGSPC